MDRVVAGLPESVEELCLVRMGLVVRKVRALPFAVKMARAIEGSARSAIGEGAGLLGSEPFRFAWNHSGVLQYWASFEALEDWSHRSPHSDWWREALERMRDREDFGVYHETFLVPRAGVESVYLDSPRFGLSGFGVIGEAVGRSTASRDRLGRRGRKG